PPLAGPVTGWTPHAERARRMGFDWIYVNPFSYPGFSGSLYAIKEHRRLHPAIDPTGPAGGLDALRRAVPAMREARVEVLLDVVVNPRSKATPPGAQPPTGFKRRAAGATQGPSVPAPGDTRRGTVWGDLAEVDNAGSPDRDGLWRFWEEWLDTALDLG